VSRIRDVNVRTLSVQSSAPRLQICMRAAYFQSVVQLYAYSAMRDTIPLTTYSKTLHAN
jgi:hypothetical protein